MITYIEYLGIPEFIAIVLVAALFIMQIIGLILDIKGKAVPMIMNFFGYFRKKKKKEEEISETLQKVERLLTDVNGHYSADNIAKRNEWMCWVNDRAEIYDQSIVEINNKLDTVTAALENNTLVTEEMFVQTSRDRIIDFASKICNGDAVVSREEYNRIFKVYEKYEDFLKQRELTNGEIDINYQIIKKSYEDHLINHTFAENIKGYE